MPKTNAKTANTNKRRTKVKELSTERNLDAGQTKKVRGGVIAIIAPNSSARMGDGSVKPISPTLLPYIEKK